MKSNDQIPADEMLLAEALAAAKARGLRWCAHVMFRNRHGISTVRASRDTVECCAFGALKLAGIPLKGRSSLLHVTSGNDLPYWWLASPVSDRGESLGWAYRCFFTDGDS